MKRNEIFIAISCLFLGVLLGNTLATYKYNNIEKIECTTEETVKEELKNEEEIVEDDKELIEENGEAIVGIFNGAGSNDNRYILKDGSIIDTVYKTEKIYDYEPYYVSINLNEPKSQLVFINRYNGSRKTYEFPKLKDNFIPYTEDFDKKAGIITINCGIARYEFNTNTREFKAI